MKILGIALSALICLPIMASAVQDSVITGPYNISFDLGVQNDSYRVNISEPKTNEALNGDITTSYIIYIESKSGLNLCMIALSESNSNLATASPQVLESAARNELSNNMHSVSNIESATRIIDGSNGAIASGDSSLLGKGNEFKIYNWTDFLDTYTVNLEHYKMRKP